MTGAALAPLLPRIARGDAVAARELVDRYERLVWSLARRYSNNPEDSEDAVQDVFLSVWQNADRFDASRASEPVFVTVIARRRLIERSRGRKRRVATEPIDEAATMPSDELHPDRCAEAAQAVRVLGTLKPEQRMVLVLSTRDGLTHEEIAAQTGLPVGTVKTHVRRALIRVRELMLGGELGMKERT